MDETEKQRLVVNVSELPWRRTPVSYKIPEGTVAYKIIPITGEIVQGKTETLDDQGLGGEIFIKLNAKGISVDEKRSYKFYWYNGGAIGKRTGMIVLEDNRFGSLRRTTVESVTYDEASETLIIEAAWRGQWMGLNLHVPLTVHTRRGEHEILNINSSINKGDRCDSRTEVPPAIKAMIVDEDAMLSGHKCYRIAVRAIGGDLAKGVGYFHLRAVGKKQWTVHKRYSEMRTCAQIMKEDGLHRPYFPGKIMVLHSEAELHKRRNLLEIWLESAVSEVPLHPKLLELLEVKTVGTMEIRPVDGAEAQANNVEDSTSGEPYIARSPSQGSIQQADKPVARSGSRIWPLLLTSIAISIFILWMTKPEALAVAGIAVYQRVEHLIRSVCPGENDPWFCFPRASQAYLTNFYAPMHKLFKKVCTGEDDPYFCSSRAFRENLLSFYASLKEAKKGLISRLAFSGSSHWTAKWNGLADV